LLSENDLRTITEEAIDKFEKDLRLIINEVEKLRKKTDKFVSIDEIQTNILEVIDNLYVASDVLTKGDSLKDRKEFFYPSLRACIQPLRNAIKGFKT
jgi:hypothetical protein